MKFLPALIQTIKRLFMSINHIPKPGNKYFPEIVLGFDSAGGFPQMQGRDINIKTDHMTPGWYNIVIFHFSFPLFLSKNCIHIGGWRLFRIILENGTKIFEEESTVRFDNFKCIICSIFICRLYFYVFR